MTVQSKNKMHSSVACERRFCTRRVYTHLPTKATHIVGGVYSAACRDTRVHVTPSTADMQTLHWRQHLHWILTYSPTLVTKLHEHLHINILKIWPTEHSKLASYFFNILVFFLRLLDKICDLWLQSELNHWGFFCTDWGLSVLFPQL